MSHRDTLALQVGGWTCRLPSWPKNSIDCKPWHRQSNGPKVHQSSIADVQANWFKLSTVGQSSSQLIFIYRCKYSFCLLLISSSLFSFEISHSYGHQLSCLFTDTSNFDGSTYYRMKSWNSSLITSSEVQYIPQAKEKLCNPHPQISA